MRLLLFILISFIAFIGSASASMKRYDDHLVIRCNASSTADHESALSTLRHLKEFHVDAWSKTDYMFHRSHLKNVEKFLSVHGLGYSILHENVQSLIDREAKRLSQRKLYSFNDPSITSDDFFSDYRKFDEILLFFANLTAQYPGMIQKQSLGKTYEGNEQVAYIITSNKTDAKQKQAILFEGGIHSREWIAPATVTYIGAQLLEQYGTDSTITQLVDSFIWIIIPVVNIDGYDYSWTGDRMWRKTRSINAGSSCVGVDPNRNWNDHWCQAGADTDPCSDSYCGPSAFSEPCVKNVANFILNWQQDASHGKIISFIDFHSYSQLWMGPYGWTQSLPKDDTTIEAAGNAAVAAIQATTQMSYTEGPIYTTVYPASGSSADWGYGEAGIIYAFGVELRDQGQYGFQLPADQIVPSGQEILAAAKAMAQYILQNPNAAKQNAGNAKGTDARKTIDQPIVATM